MGDMVQALYRSEAIATPEALVMGTHVTLAKHGSFGEGILDIVFCLQEPSEASNT